MRPELIHNLNQVFTRDVGVTLGDNFIRSSMIPERAAEWGGISHHCSQFSPSNILIPPSDIRIEGGDVIPMSNEIWVGYSEEEDFSILVQELRCPKCQNQNIADSNAGLAKDIKDRAYKLLREGKSRGYITHYMVERYGDFITYRPPITKNTWVLWFGPLVLLIVVVLVIVMTIVAVVGEF